MIALLAALALAPSAAAAQEGPSLPYGGGWAGQRDHLWLRLDPATDGQTLRRVVGRIETRCGALPLLASDVPLGGGAVDTTFTSRSGMTIATWRLRGALTATAGRGTIEGAVEVLGRRARRCSVRARPWTVAVGATSTSLAAPVPRGRYGGATAGDGMVSLLVGRRPDRIRSVLAGIDMAFCPRRRPDRLWLALDDITVEDDFDFRTMRRFTLREGSLVRRLRVQVDGSFRSDGVDGRLFVREVTRRAGDGRRVSACETGAIFFEADAP